MRVVWVLARAGSKAGAQVTPRRKREHNLVSQPQAPTNVLACGCWYVGAALVHYKGRERPCRAALCASLQFAIQFPSKDHRDGNLLVGASDRETTVLPLTNREPAMFESSSSTASSRNESWENEGGSVAPIQLAEALGITRQITETYSVGRYHYTNLTDAIAQARRMAKLERELL